MKEESPDFRHGECQKSHTTYKPKTIDNKLENGDWYISEDAALKNGVVYETLNDLDVIWQKLN